MLVKMASLSSFNELPLGPGTDKQLHRDKDGIYNSVVVGSDPIA